MQRDLSTVKSEKEKAEARVDVLSGRIKNAEARVRHPPPPPPPQHTPTHPPTPWPITLSFILFSRYLRYLHPSPPPPPPPRARSALLASFVTPYLPPSRLQHVFFSAFLVR